MRVLSPILQRVIYPAMAKVGYFHQRASASVITYHGVLPQDYRSTDAFVDNTLVSIDTFRAQLRLLKRNYSLLSPEFFLSWIRGNETLPPRAVLLTCDDGLLNNATVMLPILQEEGLQCLFFVTGTSTIQGKPTLLWYIELYLMLIQSEGRIRAFAWRGLHVREAGPSPGEKRTLWLQLMTALSRFTAQERTEFIAEASTHWGWDQAPRLRHLDDAAMRERFQLLMPNDVKQLSDAGMMIGSHTMSHPLLSHQTDESALDEIARSRKELEACTGRAVWALAYPYGNPEAVGEREYDIARQSGYDCAFMNIPGELLHAGKFALPRVHVTAEMSLTVFEAHVSGIHERLRNLIRPSQPPPQNAPRND